MMATEAVCQSNCNYVIENNFHPIKYLEEILEEIKEHSEHNININDLPNFDKIYKVFLKIEEGESLNSEDIKVLKETIQFYRYVDKELDTIYSKIGAEIKAAKQEVLPKYLTDQSKNLCKDLLRINLEFMGLCMGLCIFVNSLVENILPRNSLNIEESKRYLRAIGGVIKYNCSTLDSLLSNPTELFPIYIIGAYLYDKILLVSSNKNARPSSLEGHLYSPPNNPNYLLVSQST